MPTINEAYWAGGGLLLATAGNFIINFLVAWWKSGRESRADAFDEMQKVMDRQDKRLAGLETQHVECQRENATLRAEVAGVRSENAKLRAEVAVLRSTVAELKRRQN